MYIDAIVIEPKPQEKRGHPIVAWVFIILAVGALVAVANWRPESTAPTGGGSMESTIMEFQAKYMIGVSEMPGARSEDLYRQVRQAMNTGPVSARLRFVVMAGELSGAKEAIERIDALKQEIEQRNQDEHSPPIRFTKEQTKLVSILRKLYGDYQEESWKAPSLSPKDRELLVEKLDWFGRLALAPAKGPDHQARRQALAPAQRTVVLVLVLIGGALCAGALGLLGLIVFVVLAFTGRLQSGLPAPNGNGGIYAETFAIWLILYPLLSLGASWVAQSWLGPKTQLSLMLAAFGLSLTALVWPILRGVSLADLRSDIGWKTRRGVLLEVVCGVGAYLCSLPLLAMGLIMMMVILFIIGLLSGGGVGDEFTATPTPSHPIVEWVHQSPITGKLLVFALACVAAPVIEETMFRGVLYRHLREWTTRWRVLASVLFCALLNSFVFAAIHPQGLIAIPPLMALAIGFTMAREWRGSLIAPMTAHAINNGVVLTLLFSIL